MEAQPSVHLLLNQPYFFETTTHKRLEVSVLKLIREKEALKKRPLWVLLNTFSNDAAGYTENVEPDTAVIQYTSKKTAVDVVHGDS